MTRWLRAWWPALLWAAVIFVLSSIPGTTFPKVDAPNIDKVVHAGVYVVLGVLCLRSLRDAHGVRGARAVIIAAVVVAVYGVTDELHQAFTPQRTPDWRDAVADAGGGLLGALAAAWWRRFSARSRPRG